MRAAPPPFIILLLLFVVLLPLVVMALPYGEQQNPLTPGNLTSTPIPSYPTIQTPASSSSGPGATSNNLTCHLDLSDELFGGVSAACSASSPLDRDRCCPVLAAWLFAAHARSALSVPAPSPPPPASSAPLTDDVLPLAPDDSQKCVDSLHASLEARKIRLPRPNATCDTVLCFCGIRLHQIGSLTCPAAFNLTGSASASAVTANDKRKKTNGTSSSPDEATPTEAVRRLEKDCRNASFAGCSRCLHSLEKLKGGRQQAGSAAAAAGVMTDRAEKMFDRDCKLMGLTWLLARNKTLYIPTVSAVLRALMYSSHPPTKCSPDQENMPLAVDSLQFQKLDPPSSSSSPAAVPAILSSGNLVWVLLVALFGV